MSDQDFEFRLQRVLRTDAERAVRDFDPVQLASDAAAGPIARRSIDWRPAGWPLIRLILIASLLILAAAATLWLVTVGAPKRPSIVDALNDALVGSWIAPNPGNLVVAGNGVTDRLVLEVGSDEADFPIGTGRERLPASLTEATPGILTFTTRPGVDDEVSIAGTPYRACTSGEEGTYRPSRSPDGLLLTFAVVTDPCPSRQAMLARTWTRYLGRPSTGGIGVVDDLDPMFAVTLPPGSYAPSRLPGFVGLVQAAPEFQFATWKDPQGYNDPCDPLGKGNRPISDAADFVAYFRQLAGFTVDSVDAIQLDGHAATHIHLTANADASCRAGWLAQWRPAAATNDRYWYLRPGDWDSLYLVDLPTGTLMFEVLAGHQDMDAQIVPTIRILEDGLQTSP